MLKLLNQFYAFVFGYFWLPCPKCGEMFGGHQHRAGGAHVIVNEGDGPHCYCVCPACDTPELRAENMIEQQRSFAAMLDRMKDDPSMQVVRLR